MCCAIDLSGRATIVDGDTLEINSNRIRLEGIDAPESSQRCQLPVGTWACGEAAESALANPAGGETIRCHGDGYDSYGRLLATCSTPEEPNLNARLVRDGLAWAFVKYSNKYVDEEMTARTKKIGVWQEPTQPPWQYRARRWDTATKVSPNGCPIKGNINGRGERIYHTPWSRDYTKTRINLSAGERWFCTESEAIGAGWRAPKRSN